MSAPISDPVALRLALAAKALPQWTLEYFVELLVNQLGSPLTEKKLRSLSPKQFRVLCSGQMEEPDRVQLSQAHAILSGDEITTMEAPNLPDEKVLIGPKIRVAVTSNNKEQLDGHFGSCLRVLVYEVSGSAYQLVDIRPVTCTESGDARTVFMLGLIHDCQILATMSIGGPAAARVVNAEVHPLKHTGPSHSGDLLERISIALANNPAPWLQKVLNSQTQVAA